MFVDASALVAALSQESEAERVLAALGKTADAFTSPLAVLETALALARPDKWNVSVDEATASVIEFLGGNDIAIREPGDTLSAARLAGSAATRFRTGRRGLNLADCMHYASAKYFDVLMLAKANEFRQTDLAVIP